MACEPEMESMDIDSPGEGKESPCEPLVNGLNLYPVSVNASGEGLPYAPQDWPNPGDNWRWKVGRRITAKGNFVDRYLYVPTRFRKTGHRKGFASRLSLKQYIQEEFPGADVDAFFASFSWKIPSKRIKKVDNRLMLETTEDPEPDGVLRCKAGNRFCSSLSSKEDSSSEPMFCDICCGEAGFCRDCCCILCSQTIDKSSEDYNSITCEADIDGSACGHSCHIECALRAYMAGTVGGSIGLDAEYYCRRCDSRTDLVSHVKKLIHNCESNDSEDNIEKILNVCISVLRGSNRTSAKQLLQHIQSALSKIKNGSYLDDIWKMEDASADTAVNAQAIQAALQNKDKRKRQRPSSVVDKTTSTGSSERTIDLGRSKFVSSRLNAPSLGSSPSQLVGQQPRRTLLSSDDDVMLLESGPTAGQERPREMSFPEEAEVALDGLWGLANFISDGVAKFERKTAEVETVKDRLMAKISVAEAAAKAAAEREAVASAAAEEAKKRAAELEAEVGRLRAQVDGMVTGQGDMLRAFADRIFRSNHFSQMVVQLVSAMSTSVMSAVIDSIAMDIPDLDKVKYGHASMSEEETLRDFAEVLLEHTSSIPVVEQLAAQKSLLNAEVVRQCPIDKYELLEAVIAELSKTSAGGETAKEPAREKPKESEAESEVGLEGESRDGVN